MTVVVLVRENKLIFFFFFFLCTHVLIHSLKGLRLTGEHLVRVLDDNVIDDEKNSMSTTKKNKKKEKKLRAVQARFVKEGMFVWATTTASTTTTALTTTTTALTTTTKNSSTDNNDENAFAWRRVTRVTHDAHCAGGLMTIQTLNCSVVVDGVLASCFELNERWGAFESADMRFWYRVAPSVLKSSFYQRLSAKWDAGFGLLCARAFERK